ncbi:hypothetical protein ADK35_15795, partial [Streptomyces viridochromogenes]
TNAHVILEQPPEPVTSEQGDMTAPAVGLVPLVVSGRGSAGLAGQADRLASHLEEHPELDLAAVAHALVTDRGQLPDRGVVLAADREQAVAGLRALGRGEQAPGVVSGQAQDEPRLAVLFTGQGSQYPGMAQ